MGTWDVTQQQNTKFTTYKTPVLFLAQKKRKVVEGRGKQKAIMGL